MRTGGTQPRPGPPVLGSHLLHLADNTARACLPRPALQEDLLVEAQELHIGLLVRVQQEQGLPTTAHASSPATAVDKGAVTRGK